MLLHELTPRKAQITLDALARCKRLMPQGGGEDDLVCLRDEVRIVWTGAQWEHDPEQIRQLRERATEGAWPR